MNEQDEPFTLSNKPVKRKPPEAEPQVTQTQMKLFGNPDDELPGQQFLFDPDEI